MIPTLSLLFPLITWLGCGNGDASYDALVLCGYRILAFCTNCMGRNCTGFLRFQSHRSLEALGRIGEDAHNLTRQDRGESSAREAGEGIHGRVEIY